MSSIEKERNTKNMKAVITHLDDETAVVEGNGKVHKFRPERLKYQDAEEGDPVIVKKGENGAEIYYDNDGGESSPAPSEETLYDEENEQNNGYENPYMSQNSQQNRQSRQPQNRPQQRPPQNTRPVNGECPNATTILVLSIVGFFFVPCAIIALVMAAKAKKEGYKNDGKVTAGFIISIIILVIWAISLIIGIIALVAGMSIINSVAPQVTTETAMILH